MPDMVNYVVPIPRAAAQGEVARIYREIGAEMLARWEGVHEALGSLLSAQ